MAYTSADLGKVQSAITSGVRSITFADGRRTEYHSLDQLLAAARVIEAELKMQAREATGVVRRRVPFYRSGL